MKARLLLAAITFLPACHFSAIAFKPEPESKDLPGVLTVQTPRRYLHTDTSRVSRSKYTGNKEDPFVFLDPQPKKSALPTSTEMGEREKVSPDGNWKFYHAPQTRKPTVTNGTDTYTFKYGGLNLAITWSPDSQYVAYTMTNNIDKPYYDGRVYVLDLGTGEKTLLADQDRVEPIWFSEKEFNALMIESAQ